MRWHRGFSLLELLVVIVLISVLLSVAIDRLLVMRAKAEAVAMHQVLGSIRSGIQIRVAELLATNRAAEIPALAGSNPIERLAERPENYLGELFGPDPRSLAPGNWYFDTRDRTLVYLVENAEYFESQLSPARAQFSIEPVGGDRVSGMRLAARSSYAWRNM